MFKSRQQETLKRHVQKKCIIFGDVRAIRLTLSVMQSSPKLSGSAEVLQLEMSAFGLQEYLVAPSASPIRGAVSQARRPRRRLRHDVTS